MLKRSLADIFPESGSPNTDQARLQVADRVLALVETELQALDSEDDELVYLMEVLRYGVRRALYDFEDVSSPLVAPDPYGQPH